MNISHLQPIQQEAISKTMFEIKNGNKRICFVMPPASGQLVVCASIINGFLDSTKIQHPAQVLVVTPSSEIQHRIANLLKDENGLQINMLIKPFHNQQTEVVVLPVSSLSTTGTLEQLRDAGKGFDLIFIVEVFSWQLHLMRY